jgi:hypothetical protein
MKYKVDIFRATWAIRNIEHDTLVCEGPLPNDPQSGPKLRAALQEAVQAKDDHGVIAVMKREWTTT